MYKGFTCAKGPSPYCFFSQLREWITLRNGFLDGSSSTDCSKHVG